MNERAALKHIGQRIRERREELKLTKAALAERTRISRMHIRRIENGAMMSFWFAIQIANALEVTLEWMAKGNEDDSPCGAGDADSSVSRKRS